jgi:hypothetical protein
MPAGRPAAARSLLQRYRDAARGAAAGRAWRYPQAFAELVVAQLGFGFGPLLYSLYGLDRKPFAQWGSYIVNPGNKAMYAAINPPAQRQPLVDKLLFHARCEAYGLRTAPILALFPGPGLGDGHGVPPVAGLADFARLLAGHPQGLFLKRVDGSHGEGAFRVLPTGDGCLIAEGPASAAEAYALCVARAREHTLLVQPRLVNHATLQPLMAGGSFGTLRVMTWLDGATPRMLAALLRIVSGDNIADNFNGGTSGNLLAAVDPASGTVLCVRRSRSRDWPDIVVVGDHPAAGLPIPCWSGLQELVFRAHRAFDGLRLVGWDVGITPEGPLLVEGNAAPDLDLVQVAYDRGFRRDFERIAGGPLAGQSR